MDKGAPVDVEGHHSRARHPIRGGATAGFNIGTDRACDGDGYRIVVNSGHNRVRRRFTAAHELGHYVYHRDLIGDGIYDDAAYRTNDIKSPPSESENPI